MSTSIITTDQNKNIIQSLVLNGDLSKMDQTMKVSYYVQFCERIGLDPMTQPFKILKLNGKEQLYCDRSGAAQLNKVHNVSHAILAREVMNDCYVVTARASTPGGRQEESIGAVPIAGLKGEALCNAMMKAETKSKRRSTLDLLGLGILDESETDTIPGAVTTPLTVVPNADPAPTDVKVTPAVDPLPIVEKIAITPMQFHQACTRVGVHGPESANVYHKTIETFILTDSQRKQLDDLMLKMDQKKTA